MGRINSMKTQKKIQKLYDDIQKLEFALRSSLSRKAHNAREINLTDLTTQLYRKRLEFDALLARN
jgi:hypothetical protein